jgi:phytoene dehydrogenase-like protein
MSRAVVIGGGFGGLAAAIRLRAKGYDVTIIDRCKRLGGRAQVFERDGYRHDAGPTVITAPFLIEELFQLLGARMEDYVRLVPLREGERRVAVGRPPHPKLERAQRLRECLVQQRVWIDHCLRVIDQSMSEVGS